MTAQPTSRHRLFRFALAAIILLLLFALVASAGVVFAWTRFARTLPTLRGWHTTAPVSEFREGDAKASYTLKDYLAQEERVFAELDTLVKKDWASDASGRFNRFKADSICNPATLLDRNWNRSFVLESKNPIGGVLLIHGLSDAPYSLRAIGEQLHAAGYTVVWLRVPGHGTCPKALADVSWKDWAAAVRVAMKGLREKVPAPLPLVMVGYSNGGELSVNYVADSLLPGAEEVPKPATLVLISPMLAITPLAEFTELFPAVSAISGEPKLAWGGVEPEIDPFKYSSWPNNASLQAYRITQHVEESLASLSASGRIKDFPPVLTVQSAVDATVIAYRTIDILMDRLPPGKSELILYDIDRSSWLQGLTDDSFEKYIRPRLKRTDLPFVLTLVTNRSPESPDVIAKTQKDGKITESDVGTIWPRGTFSLSHVALPIPPSDAVYGANEVESPSKLPLGTLSLRGETGILSISPSLLMRMRYNPFYDWTEKQILTWIRKQTGK